MQAGDLRNAKSSMLQENNPDAACMYSYSFDVYSDRHVLGLLLCAGLIALCCIVLCCAVRCGAVLCCVGGTAVD